MGLSLLFLFIVSRLGVISRVGMWFWHMNRQGMAGVNLGLELTGGMHGLWVMVRYGVYVVDM